MLKLIFSFIIALLFIAPISPLYGQEEVAQAEQMKIWQDYMTPGSMHQMLAKSVGDWKTVSKFWMDPAGDPMVVEGTGKTEMILGGRYQKMTSYSTMMGMKTEGISTIGYDNATEEFTMTWIDNIGTGTAIAKGKYDDSTNSITMNGSMVDPMSKQELKIKQILKFLDDDHQLIEMYIDYNGQEFKSMEVELTRA
jgi:hypothetical protein